MSIIRISKELGVSNLNEYKDKSKLVIPAQSLLNKKETELKQLRSDIAKQGQALGKTRKEFAEVEKNFSLERDSPFQTKAREESNAKYKYQELCKARTLIKRDIKHLNEFLDKTEDSKVVVKESKIFKSKLRLETTIYQSDLRTLLDLVKSDLPELKQDGTLTLIQLLGTFNLEDYINKIRTELQEFKELHQL